MSNSTRPIRPRSRTTWSRASAARNGSRNSPAIVLGLLGLGPVSIDRLTGSSGSPVDHPPSSASPARPRGVVNAVARLESQGRPTKWHISESELPEVEGYEILAELGHGGMGVVYKAHQQRLSRFVALKMIRAGSLAKPEDLARFRIEAEAVAKQRHPNIIQIFDIGEVGGLPFVALELLEGGSLDAFLAGTPQPGEASARLLATLARADPRRSSSRHHPSRPQAFQRHVRVGWNSQDHGFRSGQAA